MDVADQSRHAAPGSSSWEARTFWVVVVLHLVPVWVFHYVPTQDGPAHLCNALILKEYGHSAAGYEAFFELRSDPIPNLTTHLLLAALLYVVPTLVAEKIVIALYVLLFVGAFRYFLGAFGSRCRPLAWCGLLFVFNHCFWLGFYNYCLSLGLFWAALGYFLRRRGNRHWSQAGILALLFLAQYFTHLLGFLLCLGSTVGATTLQRRGRGRSIILVGVAALPAVLLTAHYFGATGFFQTSSARRLVTQPVARLLGSEMATGLRQELAALDDEVFGWQAGPGLAFGLFLVPYYGLLAILALIEGCRRRRDETMSIRNRESPDDWYEATVKRAGRNGKLTHPVAEARLLRSYHVCEIGSPDQAGGANRLFPALLGALLLCVLVLIPNHLSFEHGGFLKPRLALLPPLLWLGCLREPTGLVLRLLTRCYLFLLLGVNLFLVTDTIRAGNREIVQYIAGIEAVGGGNRLFVVQPVARPRPAVDVLLHAADYYCLAAGNVNLDNYQASTPHFPVKFRRGVERGRDDWINYQRQRAIDVIICWQNSWIADESLPAHWNEVFCQGRLRIYRRPLPP